MNIGAIKQGAASALLEKGITSTEFKFIAQLERQAVVSTEDENAVKRITHKINAWYLGYRVKGE
ncbi:hypothetical protein [Paenibacillus sp. EKM211P]|uniref:hypothetical protein n=1 Tax=Paenibacillus sp. EKM211P TaxID=1683679 RepID=UPI0013E92A63|nr:hypothetical protein [Paenibacillus sp. EKM211P]KAF6584951.1 hypothetical protein G9G57_07260 [Paenibacillus sp. EKM211P]